MRPHASRIARFTLPVALLSGLVPSLRAQTAIGPMFYTPDEVPHDSPDLRHPAQKLTVFYPAGPAPSTGWPVILYSPCGSFLESSVRVPGTIPSASMMFGESGAIPPIALPDQAFLREALELGWAVVMVGTVGTNSCALPETSCVFPSCGPTGTLPDCRDPNLVYPPSMFPSEWNDYQVFYGEKDFTWARQFIADHARPLGDSNPSNDPDLVIDNAKVVACGVSCGATYAAFVALGPNRARTSGSTQVQQDTRCAGLIAFEAPTWWPAFPAAFPAVHWPRETEVRERAGFMSSYPVSNPLDNPPEESVLEASSISSWMRDIPGLAAGVRPQPKCFFAYVDGLGLCEDDPQHEAYDRDLAVAPDLRRLPELFIHDSWFGIVAKQDLLEVDAALGNNFHATHSRLFLQDDVPIGAGFGCLPPAALTTFRSFGWQGCSSYQTPVSGGTHYCPIVDGTFVRQNEVGSGLPVSAIDNTDLWRHLFCWMSEEFDVPLFYNVSWRNGGANPDVYVATTPRVNHSFDMTAVPGPSTFGIFLGMDTPISVTLGGGQVLLVTGTELFNTGIVFAAGGSIDTSLTVPANPALCGLQLYTQAVLGGSPPFKLTNAQDLIVGS